MRNCKKKEHRNENKERTLMLVESTRQFMPRKCNGALPFRIQLSWSWAEKYVRSHNCFHWPQIQIYYIVAPSIWKRKAMSHSHEMVEKTPTSKYRCQEKLPIVRLCQFARVLSGQVSLSRLHRTFITIAGVVCRRSHNSTQCYLKQTEPKWTK